MPLYFFEAADLGLVKIGHTALPEKRLTSLQAWSPVPLARVAVDPHGDRLTEVELHYRLRASRNRGEWFRTDDAVRAVMSETARTGSVPGGWYAPLEYVRKTNGHCVGAGLKELRSRLGIGTEVISRVFPLSAYGNWFSSNWIPAYAIPLLLEHLRLTRPHLTYRDLLAQGL